MGVNRISLRTLTFTVLGWLAVAGFEGPPPPKKLLISDGMVIALSRHLDIVKALEAVTTDTQAARDQNEAQCGSRPGSCSVSASGYHV